MVRNSAPPLALFWCHLQRWSCFCLKKKVRNMIIKGNNGSTVQGGTVFQNGSRVEPFWLHFFSQCEYPRRIAHCHWWPKIDSIGSLYPAKSPYFRFQYLLNYLIPIPAKKGLILESIPIPELSITVASKLQLTDHVPLRNGWFLLTHADDINIRGFAPNTCSVKCSPQPEFNLNMHGGWLYFDE